MKGWRFTTFLVVLILAEAYSPGTWHFLGGLAIVLISIVLVFIDAFEVDAVAAVLKKEEPGSKNQ
jgi:hypothetical protein